MNHSEKKDIILRAEEALETIRPFLKKDGGDIELIGITDEWQVQVKLLGSCKNCQMSETTMRFGIEEALKRELPQIKSVVALEN